MTTAPVMDTEECLLRAVCDRLDDRLPRLVLADHLDEIGRGEEAAAWRATADKRPAEYSGWIFGDWAWFPHDGRRGADPDDLEQNVFGALKDGRVSGGWRDYPTARAALLDLIAAWVAVELEKAAVCGWCDGKGEERVADAAGDMDDIQCRKCSGSGKAAPVVDTSDAGA